MEKKVRKAVRTYLIKDNKVVAIQYKDHVVGFYDIPGGKIEEGETSEETSIREFKEETGMDIIKQHFIGKIYLEYPDRFYDFDVFIVDEYQGEPQEFEENSSMWVDINEIQNEPRIFGCIKAIKYLKDNLNLKIESDANDENVIIYELN